MTCAAVARGTGDYSCLDTALTAGLPPPVLQALQACCRGATAAPAVLQVCCGGPSQGTTTAAPQLCRPAPGSLDCRPVLQAVPLTHCSTAPPLCCLHRASRIPCSRSVMSNASRHLGVMDFWISPLYWWVGGALYIYVFCQDKLGQLIGFYLYVLPIAPSVWIWGEKFSRIWIKSPVG